MFQTKFQKSKIRRVQQDRSTGMIDQVKRLLVDADQRLILMVRS